MKQFKFLYFLKQNTVRYFMTALSLFLILLLLLNLADASFFEAGHAFFKNGLHLF